MSPMMLTQEVIEMATESFYEDMVIDTPEKAAAIERMCANPEKYTYHCTGNFNFRWATDEFLQELMAPYIEKMDDLRDCKDRARSSHALRFSAGYIS